MNTVPVNPNKHELVIIKYSTVDIRPSIYLSEGNQDVNREAEQ
jgi:hypothetical protein